MGFWIRTKDEKKLQREKSAVFQGITMQPIGKIPQGTDIKIKLDPDKECLNMKHKDIDISLPYERIISFDEKSESQLAQSGSGIGGAIVGGALFGGAGAIVGANAKKGKVNVSWYATLTYKDKEGNVQELIFKDMFSNGKDKLDWLSLDFKEVVNGIASRYGEDITEL